MSLCQVLKEVNNRVIAFGALRAVYDSTYSLRGKRIPEDTLQGTIASLALCLHDLLDPDLERRTLGLTEARCMKEHIV
jgi:hypothetical protein